MLHIVSWNCAGWLRTTKCIRERHGTVEEWLARHNIDILALQEVKTTALKLTSDAKDHAANAAGYDTFWACCLLQKSKGFNGVATFARCGLTVSANAEIFQDRELDDEGRCLVTDHGAFVIFNVYVPNSGTGSCRLPYKMTFLRALAARIAEYKAAGRQVILLGDLNLTARPEDVCDPWRSIYVSHILDHSLPVSGSLLATLEMHWPLIQQRLTDRVIKPVEVTIARGRKVTKYKIQVQNIRREPVFLGSPYDTEEEARSDYDLEPRSLSDPTTGMEYVLRQGNEICFAQLKECLEKVTQIVFSLGESTELLTSMTTAPVSSPTRQWLQKLLISGFVDSFAAAHPRARGRFTCWDQYHNKRYINEGTRIDYILVEEELQRELGLPSPPLFGASEAVQDVDSTRAAMNACTAHGRWRPAPFDGSGILEGTPQDYAAQFYQPHTGMLYTPPQYSDHIAISHILRRPEQPALALSGDKSSRKTQPHKQQPSIAHFFGAPMVAASTPIVPAPASTSRVVLPSVSVRQRLSTAPDTKTSNKRKRSSNTSSGAGQASLLTFMGGKKP